MKLDFNFPLADFEDRPAGLAKDTVLRILQTGNTDDVTYLNKIKEWKTPLKNKGVIDDIDRVDAQALLNIITRCPITFNFAKIALREYVQKRIDASDVKDKTKK